MASDDEPIYCICRLPYDETRFMIECDVCNDWFHGSCVGVQEHQAADIEIYHCPTCTPKHGPLVLKHRRNWHRHDYSEESSRKNSAVQTGTVVFLKELKARTFPSAEEIPIKRLHGSQISPELFETEGFSVPILCEKKDGLGLTLPPTSFTVNDVEQLVGPMREIDVIDVARQDDIKMIMREWTEYYNSPNRGKILNVISLEFSNTKLSEYVKPPSVIRQVSWASNVWPEQLPEDCTLRRPEVQKYCLMGVKDSFTDFHIDFGGTSVWYHVLRGEKVFYLIEPTPKNLKLYESWLSSSNQSEKFFGDQVDKCYKMVVKQGNTLFIPTGWIHAVLTPIDSLVFGGNFLHNFNVPLQLKCHEIERSVSTPEKYLFPSYETMNWYAAKSILDIVKDFTEEEKSPPEYLLHAAQALAVSLKSWTQRKDYPRVGKQDIADYIQYGKLLKELQKEVKKAEGLVKSSSPAKAGHKRKRAEKAGKSQGGAKPAKRLKGLDELEKLTKQSLETADRERREKMYNFDDEPEENGTPAPFKSERKIVSKTEETTDSSPVKEVPQCLKFKLSNGKMVSTDRKKKGKRLKSLDSLQSEEDQKPELPREESHHKKKKSKDDPSMTKVKSQKDEEKSSPNKKSSKDQKSKSTPEGIPKLKLEKKVKEKDKEKAKSSAKSSAVDKTKKETSSKDKDKSKSKQDKSHKSSSSKQTKKSKDEKSDKKSNQAKASNSKVKSQDEEEGKEKSSKSSGKKDKKKKGKSSAGSAKSNSSSKRSAAGKAGMERERRESDSDGDNLVVDENPNKQKSSSATKPASLKLKLQSGSLKMKIPAPEGEEEKPGLAAIRGGLNGSISDILSASGYNGDSGFKLDQDSKEAIAGMLSMSGLGETPLQPPAQFSSQSSLAQEDEEEKLMEGCYRDTDFVYPSFELSEDEDESPKHKRKIDKDGSYNPRARLDPAAAKMEREHRPGAQREAIISTLASTAAKLAEHPPGSKKHVKPSSPVKPKVSDEVDFEVEPLPGPSSALDSPEPVNAFRPGIKRPVDPCASLAASQALKAKKPKKGYATAKQRLGKLLKIKKMVF